MFTKQDHSFREIREKAVQQWLDEMSRNEDLEVRGGVRASLQYIKSLKQEITQLEKANDVKDAYLKKMRTQASNTPLS